MRSPICVSVRGLEYPEDELMVEDAEAVVLALEADVVADPV